ncbi:TcmI family type II polyketide cyclase, partial [Streptomyces goshikiensis]
MHQALIVARMAPGSAPDIAGLFADSDAGELPGLIGVRRRSLFQFGEAAALRAVVQAEPALVGGQRLHEGLQLLLRTVL